MRILRKAERQNFEKIFLEIYNLGLRFEIGGRQRTNQPVWHFTTTSGYTTRNRDERIKIYV